MLEAADFGLELIRKLTEIEPLRGGDEEEEGGMGGMGGMGMPGMGGMGMPGMGGLGGMDLSSMMGGMGGMGGMGRDLNGEKWLGKRPNGGVRAMLDSSIKRSELHWE